MFFKNILSNAISVIYDASMKFIFLAFSIFLTACSTNQKLDKREFRYSKDSGTREIITECPDQVSCYEASSRADINEVICNGPCLVTKSYTDGDKVIYCRNNQTCHQRLSIELSKSLSKWQSLGLSHYHCISHVAAFTAGGTPEENTRVYVEKSKIVDLKLLNSQAKPQNKYVSIEQMYQSCQDVVLHSEQEGCELSLTLDSGGILTECACSEIAANYLVDFNCRLEH